MKIQRSKPSLKALREVLSAPTLMGSRAWTASDAEVYERGEAFIDDLVAAAPKIAEAGCRMGKACARAFANLGKVLQQT